MLTKLLRWLGFSTALGKLAGEGNKKDPEKSLLDPKVYTRSEHAISRKDISKYALKVLYRLHESGYQAFLVGGGVRDILLGLHPKDFDVATNARPEEILRLFRNSRIIGRRFRLVHVHFGGIIIEVATFRGEHPNEEDLDPSLAHAREDGLIVRDNIYGSLEEDVWRRDFTVNALYYNIADFSLIDFVGGMKDLKDRKLRLIGDPTARYREDPVRMLRAIRFAAKLGFSLQEDTEKPIVEHAEFLTNVPGARLFDEYLKLFLSGYALESYNLLRKYKLFKSLFPLTEQYLLNEGNGVFIENAFKNTDNRIRADKPVNPAFLLAAILWYPLCDRMKALQEEENLSEFGAFFQAYEDIMSEQRECFPIPRRLTQIIRDIWSLQVRLRRRKGHRAEELFAHPRFRAAYDFMLLRIESQDYEPEELAHWWTRYMEAGMDERWAMANAIKSPQRKRRKRRT